MPAEDKIDIDLFKVVFKAMAQSDNLEIMANHLTQLLVAALEIKGVRFLRPIRKQMSWKYWPVLD